MIRTQIQLTEEQYNALKELARQRKTSLAAVIRGAVDRLLVTGRPSRETLYRNALKIAGKYTSGAPDVSIEHDRYLEEIFS